MNAVWNTISAATELEGYGDPIDTHYTTNAVILSSFIGTQGRHFVIRRLRISYRARSMEMHGTPQSCGAHRLSPCIAGEGRTRARQSCSQSDMRYLRGISQHMPKFCRITIEQRHVDRLCRPKVTWHLPDRLVVTTCVSHALPTAAESGDVFWLFKAKSLLHVP